MTRSRQIRERSDDQVENWGKPSGGADSLLDGHGDGFKFSSKGRDDVALRDENAHPGISYQKYGAIPSIFADIKATERLLWRGLILMCQHDGYHTCGLARIGRIF
jgi:hypothetical protein